MNNLIFWIIVCSWVIPLGIRMYNRSRARRIQDQYRGPDYPQQNLPGPGYPPQSYPQQGYPQRNYPEQPQPGQGFPPQGYPAQNYPSENYPAQNYPNQNYPGYPSEPTVIRPADVAPQAGPPSNSSSPAPFPSDGSEPQGYRARKLAELDAKFSNGEIAMVEYMKQRGDIMRG